MGFTAPKHKIKANHAASIALAARTDLQPQQPKAKRGPLQRFLGLYKGGGLVYLWSRIRPAKRALPVLVIPGVVHPVRNQRVGG